MRPESFEYAWYIRYRWYRCSCPSGIVLVNASQEAEARDEAAARLGASREALDVRLCPEMGERLRMLCRATERELASGGPRMRRK